LFQELIGARREPTLSPISVILLDVLLKAVLPFKNTHQFWVYWFQEALPDVNHASQKRALRRPTIKSTDLHEAGKGYKSISKSLDVHVSMVRQTVYKWRKFSTVATVPRHGRPVKMTARAQHGMLNEVKKNPRVSAKDLQKSLAHANIFVDISTIRKTLNKKVVKLPCCSMVSFDR
uniref:Transposase n=1 Tax=Leptobrachium leishanense TaxID=445787 RepID=A0A8C5Q2G5_9ANUR